jgi:hypothetical protein
MEPIKAGALSAFFLIFSLHSSRTPGSPSKFLMAAFVCVFAQKVTVEICPVEPVVRARVKPILGIL